MRRLKVGSPKALGPTYIWLGAALARKHTSNLKGLGRRCRGRSPAAGAAMSAETGRATTQMKGI